MLSLRYDLSKKIVVTQKEGCDAVSIKGNHFLKDSTSSRPGLLAAYAGNWS